jgi:hypothetical protein
VATHSRNLTCAASNNCYSWYTATVMVLSGSPLARHSFQAMARMPHTRKILSERHKTVCRASSCCIVRLLPLLHGTVVLHLLYCLHPHKSGVLHIPASCACLRQPRGSILAHFIQHSSRKKACGQLRQALMRDLTLHELEVSWVRAIKHDDGSFQGGCEAGLRSHCPGLRCMCLPRTIV